MNTALPEFHARAAPGAGSRGRCLELADMMAHRDDVVATPFVGDKDLLPGFPGAPNRFRTPCPEAGR